MIEASARDNGIPACRSPRRSHPHEPAAALSHEQQVVLVWPRLGDQSLRMFVVVSFDCSEVQRVRAVAFEQDVVAHPAETPATLPSDKPRPIAPPMSKESELF